MGFGLAVLAAAGGGYFYFRHDRTPPLTYNTDGGDARRSDARW